MKKLSTYSIGLLFLSVAVFGQNPTADKNAVINYHARTPVTDPSALINNYQSAATTVSYLDGLGRPLQTVGYRATPQANDLLQQTVEYDNFGRQVRTYLPVPSNTVTGSYDPAANVQTKGKAFYDNDDVPYNQIALFDNSPLDRVKKSFGAGQAWRNSDRSTQVFYESEGNGIRYYVKSANGDINQSGAYPASSLYKTRTVDEQGHTMIGIKDKKGRLVEQQVQDESGYIITHYVYDGLDRVVAIIQPRGYELDNDNTGFSYDGERYKNYVFAYEYDNYGRVFRKHVPGGGWTSYVYDKADRPVLEQSALQATVALWSFTKYDAFGRVIVRGEFDTVGNDRQSIQNSFDGVGTPYDVRSGNGYTNQSFPFGITPSDIRQLNYYDSYDWVPGGLGYDGNGAYNSNAHYANATGLMTGSSVRSNENTSQYFTTVMHYDNKGRTVQTYQTHHKGGGDINANPVRTDYEYNFAGEVTKERVVYKINGLPETQTEAVNEYDHVGRILKVFHKINGTALQELCRYGYDEIGRMTQKKILPNGMYLYGGIPDYIERVTNPNVGIDDIARKAVTILPGTEITNLYLATIDPNAVNGVSISGLQTIDYSYHIRGMLRGMNLAGSGNSATPTPNTTQGDLFSYKLDYETTGQYDGNIGKQSWKNDKEGERSYSYTYDPAKRLKSANYAGVNGEDFSLPNMSYDENGNIGNLQRNGKVGAGFGPIDNLQYNYSGNRLTSVADNAGGGDHEVDFVPRGDGSYTYWDDGSLRSDANKEITDIFYDTYLKKPTQIKLTNNRWIKMYYDGSGKLFKREFSTGEYWEFVGNLIFKNGQFFSMNTPDGRAVFESNSWVYEFFLQDHLGNTRVAFRANGNQLQKTGETSFDPTGIELLGVGQNSLFENRFKHQGKESLALFGLSNVEDFGARNLDKSIMRWWGVDPLAESTPQISVYGYNFNNPINYIDPLGLSSESIHLDKYGTILKNIDDGDNSVYVHRNAKSEADINKKYSSGNTSAGGKKIGEIKDVINVDYIYSNTLNKNIDEAKSIYNPFAFKDNVKTGGKWDLKNDKSTIYGLGNDGETSFSFEGRSMESQDIGNHHFGAVSLAYGLFPSEKFILEQAGSYQIHSKTSRAAWQVYKKEKVPMFTNSGKLIYSERKVIQPPYGDDPRDQSFIKSGFNFYKNKNR